MDRTEDGRFFRILTIVDNFSRECPGLYAERSMNGTRVAACLNRIAENRGYPKSIRVDNGSEFYSRQMDPRSYVHGVALEFIRPGKPVENGHIESFRKLRDVEMDDAGRKLDAWRRDYNRRRPHK